ncbi:MAG: cytochrome c [Candidatus Binatia bacterium]
MPNSPLFSGRAPRSLTTLGLALLLAAQASACRQDMHDAPKYEPLEQSSFFKDKRGSRPLVAGTVARGHLKEDKLLFTGRDGDTLAESFPFPVTAGVLDRGRERFNIYCTPCHARTGEGNGMIVQRGFKQPTSFHEERLRTMPPGYFFQVMTNGFVTMPSYALQVKAEDRWAIAAYIKALQLSRHASAADLSADDKMKLEKGETDPAAGSGAGEAPGHGKEAHGG